MSVATRQKLRLPTARSVCFCFCFVEYLDDCRRLTFTGSITFVVQNQGRLKRLGLKTPQFLSSTRPFNHELDRLLGKKTYTYGRWLWRFCTAEYSSRPAHLPHVSGTWREPNASYQPQLYTEHIPHRRPQSAHGISGTLVLCY